jgi:hypothetical protein
MRLEEQTNRWKDSRGEVLAQKYIVVAVSDDTLGWSSHLIAEQERE